MLLEVENGSGFSLKCNSPKISVKAVDDEESSRDGFVGGALI